MRFLLAALLAVTDWFAFMDRGSRSDRATPQPRQNANEHDSQATCSSSIAAQGQPDRAITPEGPDHRQRTDDAQGASDERHRRGERWYWAVTGAAAVAATGATIAAAVFAAGAYVAARDQARIAQDALIAGNRPWVMLTDMSPASLSSDDEAGVTLWVNILAKNVGHSPAQNVSVTGRLLLHDFDPSPDQAMANVCQEPRSGSFIIPGQTLFPDREENIHSGIAYPFSIDAKKIWEARTARVNSARDYNIGVGRPDRAQAWAEELSKFPFYDALNLVGCINYRSSDNTTLYQTSFMFSVSAKPGGGGIPLLGGKRPIIVPPTSTPEDPDILVVHPREIQRIMPGDQIRLEKSLYSTFAN